VRHTAISKIRVVSSQVESGSLPATPVGDVAGPQVRHTVINKTGLSRDPGSMLLLLPVGGGLGMLVRPCITKPESLIDPSHQRP
jgi:hypothetical protein